MRRKPRPEAAAEHPGIRARRAREALGLSQAQVAQDLGIKSQSQYSRFESHGDQLSAGKVLALALRLGLDPLDLDPALSRFVSRLPIRGHATLLRDASDERTWTLDYQGQTVVIDALALDGILRDYLSRGIEVCAPPIPPVE